MIYLAWIIIFTLLLFKGYAKLDKALGERCALDDTRKESEDESK